MHAPHYRLKWNAQEDALLNRLVERYGARGRWATIARHLTPRNAKQCRERYENVTHPDIKKTPWTPEEDAIIFQLQARLGNKWVEIARHLKGRGANSVKNRFYSTKDKRATGDHRTQPPAGERHRCRSRRDSESVAPTQPSTGSMVTLAMVDHVVGAATTTTTTAALDATDLEVHPALPAPRPLPPQRTPLGGSNANNANNGGGGGGGGAKAVRFHSDAGFEPGTLSTWASSPVFAAAGLATTAAMRGGGDDGGGNRQRRPRHRLPRGNDDSASPSKRGRKVAPFTTPAPPPPPPPLPTPRALPTPPTAGAAGTTAPQPPATGLAATLGVPVVLRLDDADAHACTTADVASVPVVPAPAPPPPPRRRGDHSMALPALLLPPPAVAPEPASLCLPSPADILRGTPLVGGYGLLSPFLDVLGVDELDCLLPVPPDVDTAHDHAEGDTHDVDAV